jgi:phosphoribosylformylglycinamidine cyclo-ligase
MAAGAYERAGVSRSGADRFVSSIGRLVKTTHNSKVKTAVGSYASLYALTKRHWIAASTDGVGTKLKLAIQAKQLGGLGIDLVAMSVNDLLCVGATPHFFLDYIATAKLQQRQSLEILRGIVQGCQEAKCALVGGETAQMPGVYAPGEFDLAGFAVGALDPTAALPKKIPPGARLVGIASSGFHSNGYSLLRAWAARSKKDWTRELLTPTRIYVKHMLPLLEQKWLLGAAHITGSGYLNVPRMSTDVDYELCLPHRRPKVFDLLKEHPEVSFSELAQTFNLGLGMVLAVAPKNLGKVEKVLKRAGAPFWVCGETTKRQNKSHVQVNVDGPNGLGQAGGQRAVLRY